MKIKYTEEIWMEGNMYVSYAPELDMAACGETLDQAKRNLAEIVVINFEEMKKMGTLDSFLEQNELKLTHDHEDVIQANKVLIGFETKEIPV